MARTTKAQNVNFKDIPHVETASAPMGWKDCSTEEGLAAFFAQRGWKMPSTTRMYCAAFANLAAQLGVTWLLYPVITAAIAFSSSMFITICLVVLAAIAISIAAGLAGREVARFIASDGYGRTLAAVKNYFKRDELAAA